MAFSFDSKYGHYVDKYWTPRRPKSHFPSRSNPELIMLRRNGFPDQRQLLSGSTKYGLWSLLHSNSRQTDDIIGSPSNSYGYYCDNGINIALLVTVLAGLATMFYILYTKITMLTGRKKRSVEQHIAEYISLGRIF